jgi:F-type H+-transporting ATPase subunit epsilon
MEKALKLKLVTPFGSIIDKEVTSVLARSVEGEFMLYPNHMPILAALLPGHFVIVNMNGTKEIFATDIGFFEGGPGHVNVMVQHCVSLWDINVARIEKEIKDIESHLEKLKGKEKTAHKHVSPALDWARARLEIVSLYRKN